MKVLIPVGLAVLALVALAACSSSSPGRGDSGPDADSDIDSDTDADADADGDCDTDPCDDLEFPPSNGPDGCQRILLTQIDGQAFSASSRHVAISRDGSLAVFYVFGVDEPAELPEDTNDESDLYAVELDSMEMEIITVNSDGEIAVGSSPDTLFAVSPDGRFVAFSSGADNLNPLGEEVGVEIYLRDRELGTTELVSLSTEGEHSNAGAKNPVMSADARYVGFSSYSTNLVPGDTNEQADLFLRDRELSVTERVDVDEEGEEPEGQLCGNGVWLVSDDGRYVVFGHESPLCPDDEDPEEWSKDDRCDLYRRDRQTGTNLLISKAPDGFSGSKAKLVAGAPDASWVLFETGGAAHYYDDSTSEYLTRVVLGRIVDNEIEFEPILLDWADFTADYYGVVSASSTDARCQVFVSTDHNLVEHIGMTSMDNIGIENAFMLDRELGTVTLVTAAEDGTPGIIPFYVWGETNMSDIVTMSSSGDGRRTVFSTIQYGIVDPYEYSIPCWATPHLVYLRDCP